MATGEAAAEEAVAGEATRLLPDPGDHRAMVDLAQIQAAAGRIAGSVALSPQVRSEELSQLTGNDIYLNYAVPEPSTYALLTLLGAAFAGRIMVRRWRRHAVD